MSRGSIVSDSSRTETEAGRLLFGSQEVDIDALIARNGPPLHLNAEPDAAMLLEKQRYAARRNADKHKKDSSDKKKRKDAPAKNKRRAASDKPKTDVSEKKQRREQHDKAKNKRRKEVDDKPKKKEVDDKRKRKEVDDKRKRKDRRDNKKTDAGKPPRAVRKQRDKQESNLEEAKLAATGPARRNAAKKAGVSNKNRKEVSHGRDKHDSPKKKAQPRARRATKPEPAASKTESPKRVSPTHQQKNRAAVHIQRVQRGRNAKGQAKKLGAARKIQQNVRGRQARNFIAKHTAARDTAAKTIQSVQRGGKTRERLADKKNSATKIQAVQRGSSARAKAKEEQKSKGEAELEAVTEAQEPEAAGDDDDGEHLCYKYV